MLVEFEKEPNFIPVLNAKVCSVGEKAVTYEQDGRTVTVPCDSVVLAAGMRAKIALADSFMGLTPEFDEIGDCVRAGRWSGPPRKASTPPCASDFQFYIKEQLGFSPAVLFCNHLFPFCCGQPGAPPL